MSIKNLFNSYKNTQIQKAISTNSASALVESDRFIEAKRIQHEQFIPPIDFATASNFAKFGSAELYYEYAFKRIYQYYPYDGTLAEKVEFENSSSYIDKYVFDNLYPRTNGYINLGGTSYIKVLGGPHTASAGMIGKTLDSTFEDSMIYNDFDGRTSAFDINMVSGSTIEFYLKRGASVDGVQTIFDMWNGEDPASSAKYGRLKIFASGSNDSLRLTLMSGTTGFSDRELLPNAFTDNTWHHFALTMVTSSITDTINVTLFKDNIKVYEEESNHPVLSIKATTNGINAAVGADILTQGDNKLTGSLDEFRFWKKRRTHEEIANTWFIPIGGGTNKHDSNIDLGLYFKFNEGITTVTTTDSIVLDYSGRINNGHWIGYAASQRNTGSAIREKLDQPEFLDPIIYSSHPDVSASLNKYKTSGSLVDHENSSTIFNYFPAWMQETDSQDGNNLKYLSQIIGSYFDNLYHQINYIDKIHTEHYITGSRKPIPFAKKLLYNKGFVIPNIFVDASITERLLQKDGNEVYEKEIDEVRNTIYHNLYNNILNIYKSKGTEKSFRNFFRCLGINSELVKLKMYADDSTFVLRDNYEYRSYPKKFLNFNYENHFGASVYHSTSSATTPASGTYGNHVTYISGGLPFDSMTLETEIILPKKVKNLEVSGHVSYPYITSSIFGFHSASTDTTRYTWAGGDVDLNVFIIREKLEDKYGKDSSQRIRFALSSNSGSGIDLRSDWYDYQYENNKWNLAVKLKNNNYPNVDISGAVRNSYTLEFYGVEAEANIKRNYFNLTTNTGKAFVESRKRIYGGAELTNFTGSVVKYTDIKLGHIRYWHSYMSNDAVDQHAFDAETFGINEPFEVDIIRSGSTRDIPREKTLALHWGFNDLTSADSSGGMLVSDLSSGSWGGGIGRIDNYGPTYSQLIDRYNSARVSGFPANSTNALDKNYIYIARKRQPDDLLSSDLTTIKTNETEQFFVDDDVSDNFYSFEKSLYGTISEEMLNMFSTVLDFNNLIGQPNQKYHHEYTLLSFLKEKFYEDVENEPDLERFTTFYKWIDDSISQAIQQLVPASSRFSKKINNLVESHVLERNKYVNKVPLVSRFKSTEGVVTGIRELMYNWKFGHAPIGDGHENQNVVWQRQRKEKSGLQETIRNTINNQSLQSTSLIRQKEDGITTYLGSNYRIRKLAKPYEYSGKIDKTIHGGVNYLQDKNIYLFRESVSPGSRVDTAPVNIITVGVGKGNGIVEKAIIADKDETNEKHFFNYNIDIGNRSGQEYAFEVKANNIVPVNLVSGTVHSGYNKQVKSFYESNVIITNIHSDIVSNQNDVSMQGPFTEAHVGGLQYRHVDINHHDATKSNTVTRATGGSKATGSIEFVTNVLTAGDNIRILDADRTALTASYATYYDLLEKKWTQPSELVTIINYHLDTISVLKNTSPARISLTASLAGADGNVNMAASTTNITSSGMNGGANPGTSTVVVNLDSPLNRPEGWGLVFKEHPVMGDSDGAFGFVPADYGSSYPSPTKLKATRYRDEHAKRPVNIRNIKHSKGSTKAGNYNKGYEIFSIDKANQKRWYREAYDEKKVLPTSTRTQLPSTTNYMTLISQAPFRAGNIFGGGKRSNRQPDIKEIIELTGTLGCQSSGSITLFSRAFANDDDKLFFPGTLRSLVIDTNSTDESGLLGANVPTGASDTAFYDNFKTGLTTAGYQVTTSSASGEAGKAINFPNWGSNGYSYVTASEGAYYAASTKAMTISLWFNKPSSSGPSGYFFSFATSSHDAALNTEHGMVLSAKINGLRTITFAAGGTYNNNLANWSSNSRTFSSTIINGNSGSWQHLVFTFDGTTNVEGINLYHNSTVQSPTSTVNNLETAPAPIAGRIDGASVFFNALTGAMASNSNELRQIQVSNIALWNRALSSCEVSKLYNHGHLQDITSSTMASSSFAGWYRTGQFSSDTVSANAGDGITQQIFLSDHSGRGRVLSGSKTGETDLVGFASTTLKTPNTMTFFVTSSLSSSQYNKWETTSSICGPSVFASKTDLLGAINPITKQALLANDIVITVPRTDLTQSTHEINTRFSAPGGPEVQSIGYLDAQTSTYSVHNALPFKNLTVLRDSGENKKIRVIDHLNKQRGLRTLLALPMGQFGIDRTHGTISSTAYPTSGSFYKQYFNTHRRMENSGSSIITGSRNDNFFVSSPIPRSEFQYGWVNSAISSSNWRNNQRILGYAPRDGEISSSAGFVPALVFPSASTINGS